MSTTDSEIDAILRHFDELFSNGQFTDADRELQDVDVSTYSTVLLIALLTATAPASSELRERAGLLGRVRAELETRPEDAHRIDRLLVGL